MIASPQTARAADRNLGRGCSPVLYDGLHSTWRRYKDPSLNHRDNEKRPGTHDSARSLYFSLWPQRAESIWSMVLNCSWPDLPSASRLGCGLPSKRKLANCPAVTGSTGKNRGSNQENALRNGSSGRWIVRGSEPLRSRDVRIKNSSTEIISLL